VHEDAPPVDVRAPFRVADEEPIEVAELVLTEGEVTVFFGNASWSNFSSPADIEVVTYLVS
jgi:hypothetical protein